MGPPAKRRKTEPKIEEIVFDPAARQDYLTGFHKRKVQRAKHAQEIADKRAREDRIEARKKLREERKADLERHVQQVKTLLRAAAPDDDEKSGSDEGESDGDWKGIDDPEPPPPIDHEAEYIDEDKYTTVTVEAMDVSRDGLTKASQDSESEDDGFGTNDRVAVKDDKKRSTIGKDKTKVSKPKSLQSKLKKRKKRDFKYESKTERKVSRLKEKSKNSKRARARKAG